MALCVFLIFAPALSGEFLNYDDPELLTQHPFFQEVSLWNLISFWNVGAFFQGVLLDFSPLRDMSYMLDRIVWGWNPWGFHLTQVLLHAANAMLVYVIIKFYLPAKSTWPLLGALFWALHPVQVEPVAWVSSRKDVLMGFFFFSALGFYLKHKSIPASVMTVGSVLSKYTALSLVPILGVLSLREKRRQNFIWGLALFAGVFAIVVVLGNKHAAKLVSEPGLSWAMLEVPLWIFKTLVAPIWLSARYVQPAEIDGQGVIASFALVGLFMWMGVSAYRWKNRPLSFMGLVIFVGTLLPTAAQMVLGHPIWMADRYLYLPLFGFTLWLVDHLAQARAQKIALGISWSITLILVVMNVQRQPVWKNSVALWEDTILKSPSLYYAQGNMGAAYLEVDDIQKAIPYLMNAVSLNPGFGEGYMHLSLALAKLGKKESALYYFQKSEHLLSATKKNRYLSERGLTLALIGDPKSGEAFMLEHLKVYKGDAATWSNLGTLYANYQMNDRALAAWQEALRVEENHLPTLRNRFIFLLKARQCPEALADLTQLKSAPNYLELQKQYTLECRR